MQKSRAKALNYSTKPERPGRAETLNHGGWFEI